MGLWSFRDSELQDFLRDEDGEVIKIKGTHSDAENWLLEHGEDNGWTNTGVNYHDWEEDENED